MSREKGIKTIHIAFAALIVTGLLFGIVHALFMPYIYSAYENRMMKQLPELTAQGVISGDFQNQTESAMADQIPFSSYFKKAYNVFNSKLILGTVGVLDSMYPGKAWNVSSMRIFDGRLLYYRNGWESIRNGFDAVTESYNRAEKSNPDAEFFYFYIETDTTFDPLTGEKNPAFEYMTEKLNAPKGCISRLECSSLETFEENFFKTDHHWNGHGAYEAYRLIADMMSIPESDLMHPMGEQILPYEFFGTKAAGCGLDTMTEQPTVLKFNYPDYGIDFGNELTFLNGIEESFSYGKYYGGDEPEIVFDTGDLEKENILILGDSYDNAVLKLLASHFNRTYSIDQRYYTEQLKLSDYMEGKNISKVLVIGSDFLYSDPTFCVGE